MGRHIAKAEAAARLPRAGPVVPEEGRPDIEIIRIVPYWPRDRYLELAPRYWRATRAWLSPEELKLPLGHITVPRPPSAEEQSASN